MVCGWSHFPWIRVKKTSFCMLMTLFSSLLYSLISLAEFIWFDDTIAIELFRWRTDWVIYHTLMIWLAFIVPLLFYRKHACRRLQCIQFYAHFYLFAMANVYDSFGFVARASVRRVFVLLSGIWYSKKLE